MRKTILVSLMLICAYTINAQEIQISKPIKTFYTSMLKDIEIKTAPEGDGVIFSFRDETYQQIDEFEYIYFEDKEAMLHFFNKVEEVQMSPKTEKTVDITIDMNDHVTKTENKDVSIIRLGSKQFVTYIYYGSAFTIIPKTRLKKILKKIRNAS